MTAPTYLSTYDAWGNFTSSLDTIQSFPTSEQLAAEGTGFRYRGYYYDTETGLYYLNARYYDSAIHRFVNRDDISYLGATGDFNSYNLYAYCSNNPVMYVDPMGTESISIGIFANCYAVSGCHGALSIAIDDSGNIAIQETKAEYPHGYGVCVGIFGANAGYNISLDWIENSTVYDLEGISVEYSGPTMGIIQNLETDEITGVSFSRGASVGTKCSATASITKTLCSININEIFKKIKEFFYNMGLLKIE